MGIPHAVHGKSALPSRKSRNSGRVVQPPALAPSLGERLAEQRTWSARWAEEVLLVGRLLVGVRRGDHHLVHLELVVEEVEDLDGSLCGVSVLKNVEFVVTRKPRALSSRIAATASSNTPAWQTDASWLLAQAVDVDGEGEVGRRPEVEPVDPLAQQHGVRAQVDEALAGDERVDDLADLGVQERLAAGDRDHRGPALLDRPDRLLDADPSPEDVGGVLDLAAPGAGEVAGEQRLELDDQRELVPPARASAWPGRRPMRSA